MARYCVSYHREGDGEGCRPIWQEGERWVYEDRREAEEIACRLPGRGDGWALITDARVEEMEDA